MPPEHKAVVAIITSHPITDHRRVSVSSAEALVHFAQNYRLLGAPLTALCHHNSAVAAQLQRPQIAQIWLIIDHLFHTASATLSLAANHSLQAMLQTVGQLTPGATATATDGRALPSLLAWARQRTPLGRTV